MQIASGDLSDTDSRPRGSGSASSLFPSILPALIRCPADRLPASFRRSVRSRRQMTRYVSPNDIGVTRIHDIRINADSHPSFAKRSDGWRNARNSLLTMESERRIIRASPDGLQYL